MRGLSIKQMACFLVGRNPHRFWRPESYLCGEHGRGKTKLVLPQYFQSTQKVCSILHNFAFSPVSSKKGLILSWCFSIILFRDFKRKLSIWHLTSTFLHSTTLNYAGEKSSFLWLDLKWLQPRRALKKKKKKSWIKPGCWVDPKGRQFSHMYTRLSGWVSHLSTPLWFRSGKQHLPYHCASDKQSSRGCHRCVCWVNPSVWSLLWFSSPADLTICQPRRNIPALPF